MAGFDLATALGLKKVSNLDTEEIREIRLEEIEPNPKNFFEVEEDISDLVESIKLNGLLQPPVVTPSQGGRYRLIAGHRRHKALKTLAAEEPEKYAVISCRVVHPASEELEELMLIQTNTETRVIGWREKSEAAKRTEKILTVLQSQGVELPGKRRRYVADILKTSESQLARASFIDRNLIASLASIPLADNVAYRVAHFAADHQEEIYRRYKDAPESLTGAEITRFEKNIRYGRELFYSPPPNSIKPSPPEKLIDSVEEKSRGRRAGSRVPQWRRYLYRDYTPREGELFLVVMSDKTLPSIVRCKPCRWRRGRFVLAANEFARPIENMVCFLPLSELPDGFTFSISGGDGDG